MNARRVVAAILAIPAGTLLAFATFTVFLIVSHAFTTRRWPPDGEWVFNQLIFTMLMPDDAYGGWNGYLEHHAMNNLVCYSLIIVGIVSVYLFAKKKLKSRAEST